MKISRRVLYALALVAVVGCVFVYSNAPRIFRGAHGEHIIEIRNDGFYPSTLIIDQGEKVTFITKRKLPFWPASNVHPTHTVYPEFDAKRPVLPAESWEFQFDRAGTWNFHDHLAAAFIGSITVRAKGENTVAASICSDEHSTECWESRLLNELNSRGLDAAFDLVSEFYATEPGFPVFCHGLAHNIGLASYRLYVKDPASVLSPKTSYCAMGFYHGFMEGLLSVTRDIHEAKDFCTYVGKELGTESPDAELQCYHGIGHGAMDMTVSGGNISKASDLLSPALRFCEEASDTDLQLYRCASGAFNGIANFYTSHEYGLSVDEKDPLALCHTQADVYKDSCYGNMNTVLTWLAQKQGDFVGAGKFIEKIPDKKYAASTMRYYSNLSNLHIFKYAGEQGLNACRQFSQELVYPCIEGLVTGHLEHGTPGEEYRGAVAFCRLGTMEKGEREACLKYALGNLDGFYSSEKAKEICSTLPSDEKIFCPKSLSTI